jgi:hypothetical protein
MSNFKLKPTHAPVKTYYETLERFERGKFDNEGNVRRAFEALLEKCARSFEWMVVPEFPIPRAGRNPAKVDAAVPDAFNIPRGYWEAKDEKDDLKAEMNKKFADGYPRTNILFGLQLLRYFARDEFTCSGFLSEHSHTILHFHSSLCRSCMAFRSRCLFLSIFFTQ